MLGGLGLIDSQRLGKQFFSHVGMEPPLPGYYQYFLGSKCALLKDTKQFDPSGARTPNLWYFKFRYEMLRLHAFWYDFFRLDAICQFMVTRSVTIESPFQIRSHTSEYGISRSSTGLS